jgi:hypothetical protein
MRIITCGLGVDEVCFRIIEVRVDGVELCER